MKRRQPIADYLADLERRAAEHVSYHDVIQPERVTDRVTPIEQPREWELSVRREREHQILKWLLLGLGAFIGLVWLLTVLR